MKTTYFEVNEPYYALLKVDGDGEEAFINAVKLYEKVVGEFDGEDPSEEVKEIQFDYALIKFSRGLNEMGQLIPIEELLDSVRRSGNEVLLVDGNL